MWKLKKLWSYRPTILSKFEVDAVIRAPKLPLRRLLRSPAFELASLILQYSTCKAKQEGGVAVPSLALLAQAQSKASVRCSSSFRFCLRSRKL